MSLEHVPKQNRMQRRADLPDDSLTGFSVNEWCDKAGVGRTRCYEEIKQGRVTAKKCGSRTLIATSPKEWLDSLPSMAAA